MLQSVELPKRQDRLPKHASAKRALMLFASKACQALRLRGGDLRARFAARSRRVLVLGAQEHPQGFLYLAYTPPQPALVPHITRMQKLSAALLRLLVLGVYPPPAGAGPRYYPCAKVISSARSDLQKVLLRGVYPPPPSRGRSPLLPVCKSYQQCTNRPPHGKGVRFRVAAPEGVGRRATCRAAQQA